MSQPNAKISKDDIDDFQSVAILIPCYQEAETIKKVIEDFKRELPDARIYVYDNNCTDNTARIAKNAGAIVRKEKRQGKGYVIGTMFDQINEDIIILVDGDDTYEASYVHRLMEPVLAKDADMVIATRLTEHQAKAFRPLHIWGNRLVCSAVNWIFQAKISDIFSGYRVFTKAAVRQIPITAKGFDVETELTLQALYRGQVIHEVMVPYRARPIGSFSKLNTIRDGFKVVIRLLLIIKSYKPLTFFGSISFILFIATIAVGIGPVFEFLTKHYVYRVPSAILAGILGLLGFGSLAVGLILNSLNLRLMELERLIQRKST